MEKFPEIKNGQAVLMRAETNTGHVLDESFNPALSDDQKVFTIFNTVEKALEATNKILSEKNKLVECVIYKKDQEIVRYLNPYQIK